MKKILIIFLALSTGSLFGQKNLIDKTQLIVDEGKTLYKSEMASWYGSDLFLEKYKEQEKIGGYFSYTENNISKCIFFSKIENPRVIGTISFDSTYNVKTAKTDLTERDFTKFETDMYQIRKIAFDELSSNKDGLFKFYQNTNPNIIPLINDQEKKVYILTGPQKNGVVIFGNDYLLTFNNQNKLTSKKQLHKNIIPIEYSDVNKSKEADITMHSHVAETGDFITATDICTLMLYEKFAKWKTHNVVSQKYLNIWNCETNELTVISKKTVEKINKDQEKKNKKKNN
jgi:hypothetical protein